ncbi:Oidioi.mRNA.OKI2018_I69.chr2.g7366.t1.cds [Oikopleura dioica]|uniref:Oidioi.mRNA.OKI2018_I69.chr2.g7366.t1.cds n=1 Tax=Oikopleura dioica TaxID=34765 RepID=A0ABN7TCU4_OIKDI|nr:Oidioi.mRNA.OKI2018_I69.chr2.g7366.t1.cds [Oikopleura dioica]
MPKLTKLLALFRTSGRTFSIQTEKLSRNFFTPQLSRKLSLKKKFSTPQVRRRVQSSFRRRKSSSDFSMTTEQVTLDVTVDFDMSYHETIRRARIASRRRKLRRQEIMRNTILLAEL